MTEDVRSSATRLLNEANALNVVDIVISQQLLRDLLTLVADLSQQIAKQERLIEALVRRIDCEIERCDKAEATLAQQARESCGKAPMTTDEMKRAIFYGPHPCETCGQRIAKAARANGGYAFDYPNEGPYPNTEWQLHSCSGSLVVNNQLDAAAPEV